MPELTQLRQHLNFEAHGGHQNGGHSALLNTLNTLDDLLQDLEEQERWIRDEYGLDEGQCLRLVDQIANTFLEHLSNSASDVGPDYLIGRVIATMGSVDAVQKALDFYKDSHPPLEGDALGDLDDHPF